MKALRHTQLANPEFLGAIRTDLLRKFLQQYVEYFASRGVELANDELDYGKLCNVIAEPTPEVPDEMAEALYYLDAVCTPRSHEDLASAARKVFTPSELPDEDRSTGDLAVLVWMKDRTVIERVHAEQWVYIKSQYDAFVPRFRELPQPPDIDTGLEAKFESVLGSRLKKLDKGGAIRVYGYKRKGRLCLVAHFGTALQRDMEVKDNESKPITYKPVKHGVLVYYPNYQELEVHAETQGVKRALVETFGRVLFGDSNTFVSAQSPGKYNLKPLLEKGAACLDCSGSEHIRSAALVELGLAYDGAWNHREVLSSSDVFQSLEAMNRKIPTAPKPRHAVIEYNTSQSLKSRRIRLRPPNSASYDFDSDSEFVEPWLREIGLINTRYNAAGITEESFWTRFEQFEKNAAPRSEWCERFRDSYAKLEPLLVSAGQSSNTLQITPIDGFTPRQDRRIVEHNDGQLVAVADEPGVASVPVAKTDLQLVRIDAERLCHKLCQLLGLTAKYEPIEGCGAVWQIAVDQPLAGINAPVLLAVATDHSHLNRMVNEIYVQSRTPSLLFLPTRRHLNQTMLDKLAKHKIAPAVLDEVLLEDESWFKFTVAWTNAINQLREITVPETKRAVVRFPTPPDTRWSDITMQFTEWGQERLSIRVGQANGIYTPVEMGMANMKNKKPAIPWEVLRQLANYPARRLDWESSDADRDFKQRKARLSKALRKFFGIDEEPIEYDKQGKAYIWRFTILPEGAEVPAEFAQNLD